MNEKEQLEQRIQELMTLWDASKELNTHLDQDKVFDNILQQMMQVIGAEAGTLWIADADGQQLQAVSAFGAAAEEILNVKVPRGQGVVWKVLETGQAQRIEDVTRHADWNEQIDQESGFITSSLLTVPLIVKSQLLGSLQLLNKRDGEFFTEADLRLAEALAHQSALALHNSQMYDELNRMLLSMIRTLASLLDARDPYTAGHSERVANYSLWIAQKIGMTPAECEELYKAALLHDIGKIGIRDELLQKPGRLSQEEFQAIQQHTTIGAGILANMEPQHAMERSVETAKSHHERINGSGYPEGLKGDAIPLFARIVGVADAFDAMTTARPYSTGRTEKQGAVELLRCRGELFEAHLVDAMVEILEECQYDMSTYKTERRYRI
ncbi:GAF domain-containing protein [Planococcus sp. CP5-4]|uniref:GAF and HD-GYP domain-containing protein n=1 Tax=unclassified Planococcus (in: firmicutes) TaxID=2662419 RepID=UPI001C241DD9|nr:MULTISPECIES: HD domain-containing phosphohydrolase [unclassified Planococcus (in: firmicutes)]MBU9672630.1 GAF domain-containing protein [Planococcus sp. CP5-4_YE]MBV0909680.1 GAF domain-containing protein [Planococcus sp. CP5-4_UN]MBW6064410.1 GAF domain-containing protein [Planococcus sp. CP5-4]